MRDDGWVPRDHASAASGPLRSLNNRWFRTGDGACGRSPVGKSLNTADLFIGQRQQSENLREYRRVRAFLEREDVFPLVALAGIVDSRVGNPSRNPNAETGFACTFAPHPIIRTGGTSPPGANPPVFATAAITPQTHAPVAACRVRGARRA